MFFWSVLQKIPELPIPPQPAQNHAISPARPLARAKSLPLPSPPTSARDPDSLFLNCATVAVGRGLSKAAGKISEDCDQGTIRAPIVNLDQLSKIDAYEQNFDQGATENAKI